MSCSWKYADYIIVLFWSLFRSTSSKSGSVKRTSSRLQDPERAAKHKAFLQKVTVATNGSMESFLEQEATKTESVPPLKRKISPTGAQSDSKRRRSSRNNSAGQVHILIVIHRKKTFLDCSILIMNCSFDSCRMLVMIVIVGFATKKAMWFVAKHVRECSIWNASNWKMLPPKIGCVRSVFWLWRPRTWTPGKIWSQTFSDLSIVSSCFTTKTTCS